LNDKTRLNKTRLR